MQTQLTETQPYGKVLKSRTVSGFHLMETLYSKKSRVPRHEHEEAICCIALSGSCDEVFLGKTRQIKTFTLDFLPPEQAHSLQFPSATLRAFSVDIAPRWLERMREISLSLVEALHSQAGLANSILLKIYKEFQQSDAESDLAVEGLALELLAELSRRRTKTGERAPPLWLRQARDLIHAHFSESLRLTRISQTVGVHPVHVAREFRKQYGCTVGDYVRKLRVNYASDQLSGSEKPLANIAAEAGFADQSHFSRSFRRFTSMTPTEYRASFTSR